VRHSSVLITRTIQKSVYQISIMICSDVKHPELDATPNCIWQTAKPEEFATRASASVMVADNGEFDANTVSCF